MSRLTAWVASILLLVAAATPAVTAEADSRAAVPLVSDPAGQEQGQGVVGAQTAGDSLFPHQGNGGYDVLHYQLDIRWSTSKAIKATAYITAATTQQPLTKYSFDLEGLTVTSVVVDGVEARFSRVSSGDKHKLVVTPRTPVTGEFTTAVSYSGTPVTHVDPDGSREGWFNTGSGASSGVVTLNEPVGAMTWFPNNNTPRDKATYRISVTVPYSASAGSRNRIVVSNGVPTDGGRSSTTRTFAWLQPRQQASYLAFVAIGPFAAARSEVALAGGGSIEEYSYRDSELSEAATGFATARADLGEIVHAIGSRYGTYPGASTGLVVDTVPSGVDYALETQDRPFFPSRIDRPTLIHELAHQWFGNSVSPADWGDVWLNEGPASFVETQVQAELDGGPSTRTTYYNIWRRSTTASLWAVPAAGFDQPLDLFGEQVYTRGAVALEALRSTLGDDVFSDVMRTWLTKYGGRSASTEQFNAVAERVSGRELTPFFNVWIYGTSKPASWPVAYDLSLRSDPVDGSDVAPGSKVTFTVTAHNSGIVPTGASTVEIPAADLRERGILDPLPDGVTRDFDTLLWEVPTLAVGETGSVSFSATLSRKRGGTFSVRARGRTPGADCSTGCATRLTLPVATIDNPDPVIDGRARVGDWIYVSVNEWDLEPDYTWQWLRDGVVIPGAVYSAYEPTVDDLGAALTVRVTGSGDGYRTVTRTSPESVVVAPGLQRQTPTPDVVGEPRVGSTVQAVHEPWEPESRLTYQWLVDGEPVGGATSTTYRPVASQVDRQLSVAVTGTRPGYTTVTRTSESVQVIPVDAPVSPTPTIAGDPRVDQTITAVPGEWTGGATLSYQWNRGGEPVRGATSPTLRLGPGDALSFYSVTVTGTRDGFPTMVRTSEAVTIKLGVISPAPTPTVSGVARPGQTLRGDRGTWASDVLFSYNWIVNGVGVPGPSSTTYVVRPQDVGKSIVFSVAGDRYGYGLEIRESRAQRVTAGDQVLQPTPSIVGTPEAGRSLRAYVGAHDPGALVTVRWYRGATPIPGATARTYRLRLADRGRSVRVLTRTSKPGYRTVLKFSPVVHVR